MRQIPGNAINDTNGVNPVTALRPVDGVSDRYGFVSTQGILDIFQDKGWSVVSATKSKVRDVSKDGFQRHLIVMSHPDFNTVSGLTKDNDSAVRLCLFNSHDMSTSLMGSFGLYRGACLNLNLFGTTLRHFRAVHSKSITSKVSQGMEYLVNGIPELIENVQRLQSVQLTERQRYEYAKSVIDARLQNVNNILSVDYTCIDNAIRSEDAHQDGYTVMNRVQEYIIRGGVPYTYRRDLRDVGGNVVSSNIIHTKTRKVASIATQLRLNEALTSNIFDIANIQKAV